MSLTHANEFFEFEINCEIQIICELFKLLEIHIWRFTNQKNANDILKCSTK